MEVQVAFDTILFDKHAGVATVTMNRPERLNAMTWHIIEEFLDAIEDCRQDDAVLVLVFTGAGRAFSSDGGYRWTGSGAYSSGIDHCNWVSPALSVPGDDGKPVRKWLLIPRSDFEIVDDWFTVGLKGTGSKTIVVDDVFIPDNRAVSSEDMQAGTSPGARFHANPQYSAPSVCIFTPPLAGTAIGAARGFLHAFEQRMRSRLAVADAQQAGEQGAVVIRWAKACADVDAARVVLLENARRFSRTPPHRSTSSVGPAVGAIRRTRRRRRVKPSTAYLNQVARAHSSKLRTFNVCGETRTRRRLTTG